MKIVGSYNPEIVIPDYLSKKIDIEELIIGDNILSELNAFFKLHSAEILLLCDCNTYNAAGIKTEQVLSESNKVRTLILNGEVHCDSKNADLAADKVKNADVLIAVGSGTLNDIGRLVAHRQNIDFFSVATAPSMDGYLSANSSLIENAVKVSYSGISPAVKVFVDMDIIRKAPSRLFISGIGDSLAKILSVFDWHLDSFIRKSRFNRESHDCVNESLSKLISVLADNGRKSNHVEILTEFLLLSGAVMNAERNSQPASGGEHLVGHVIEMFEIKRNVACPSYHGEKIAVSTRTLFNMYIDFFSDLTGISGNFRLASSPENYFQAWENNGISIQENIILNKINYINNFNFTEYNFLTQMGIGISFIKDIKNSFDKLYDIFHIPGNNHEISIEDEDWNFALQHAGDIRERITTLDLINCKIKEKSDNEIYY